MKTGLETSSRWIARLTLDQIVVSSPLCQGIVDCNYLQSESMG